MVTLPPLPIKTKNVKQKLPYSFPFTFVKVRPGIFLFCVNQRLIVSLIAAIVKTGLLARDFFFRKSRSLHALGGTSETQHAETSKNLIIFSFR